MKAVVDPEVVLNADVRGRPVIGVRGGPCECDPRGVTGVRCQIESKMWNPKTRT